MLPATVLSQAQPVTNEWCRQDDKKGEKRVEGKGREGNGGEGVV